MNKDELKGKLDHLKGRVKEAAEALSGKEKHAGSHAGSEEGGATEKIKQAGERAADAARDKPGEVEETDDE